MLEGKTRKDYEEVLGGALLEIKKNRKKSANVSRQLFDSNRILEGNTQSLIDNPKKNLPKSDWRVNVLLGQKVSRELQDKNVHPNNFYTEIELKKATQYSGLLLESEDIKLPITLENASKVGYRSYSTTIDVKTLAHMSSSLLNYNFDIQRESVRRIVGNKTIREATLVMDNVLEMKEHLKQGTLMNTMIVINASIGTSDSGRELYFDENKKTITIDKGTVLDIVDGYHRCKASELALNENPKIEFNFMVLLLNYTDEEASKYQGQLAKATPISKIKERQLSSKSDADQIVNRLMNETDLRDKIVAKSRLSLRNREIATFGKLSDAIQESFNFDRSIDSHLVFDYLEKVFNMLIADNEKYFNQDLNISKKETIVVREEVILNIVHLAGQMYLKNINPYDIIKYIKKEDMKLGSKLLEKYGIIDGDTLVQSRKRIGEMFDDINV